MNINNKNILAYNDIKDTYYTETKGSNFSTTIGSDPNKGKANIAPMGSTTIGFKDTGSEREQETRATIGGGSIIIANKEINKENNNLDLIRDLNRDKDKSQQITKDMITGALDGSMTVDNRLFTKSGRESIGKDFNNFGSNTKKSIAGAAGTTSMILSTTSDILGVIPGSPVWASRKLTEETGIPPHLLPSLWIGDEVMGRASISRDENNKPILDEAFLNQYTQKKDAGSFGSDTNPLFKFLYAVVPGGKASTDQHDILMNKYGINSNLGLAGTILPSFAATYYGAVGTIFDFKNYGSNASKIKDSYDNSVPKNSIIINSKGKIIKNTWKNNNINNK